MKKTEFSTTLHPLKSKKTLLITFLCPQLNILKWHIEIFQNWCLKNQATQTNASSLSLVTRQKGIVIPWLFNRIDSGQNEVSEKEVNIRRVAKSLNQLPTIMIHHIHQVKHMQDEDKNCFVNLSIMSLPNKEATFFIKETALNVRQYTFESKQSMKLWSNEHKRTVASKRMKSANTVGKKVTALTGIKRKMFIGRVGRFWETNHALFEEF